MNFSQTISQKLSARYMIFLWKHTNGATDYNFRPLTSEKIIYLHSQIQESQLGKNLKP